MRYKSRAIHFEHKDVVYNPYRATIHELHHALVAKGINGEADAVAGIYMPCLGEETDVEWQACHITRCLRRIKPSDTLPRARIVPLPLFHVAAKFGVGLSDAHVLNGFSNYSLIGGNSWCINLSISLSLIRFTPLANIFLRWRSTSGKRMLQIGFPQSAVVLNTCEG